MWRSRGLSSSSASPICVSNLSENAEDSKLTCLVVLTGQSIVHVCTKTEIQQFRHILSFYRNLINKGV